MNFIWTLLQTHRGSIDILGSLSQFFAILEKVRLGSDKPDYHTLLLAALTQILEGLILNACQWRIECGNLYAYASSKSFRRDYSCKGSFHSQKPRSHKNEPVQKANRPLSGHPQTANLQDDVVHENIVCGLTRDLLYVNELIDAISCGDFGHIEDTLFDPACMFQLGGARSNNYSMEILHFLLI